MKTIDMIVYTLKELNKDVREKVMNRESIWNNIIIEDQLLEEADMFENKLAEFGFTDAKIFYDLNFNQGSGLSFEFSEIDTEKLESFLLYDAIQWNSDIIRICKYLDAGLVDFETVGNSFRTHYVHKHTLNISFTEYFDTESYDGSFKSWEKAQDVINWFIENTLKPVYDDLCDCIEEKMKEVFIYLLTDIDYRSEFFEMNNIYFTKDGDAINL